MISLKMFTEIWDQFSVLYYKLRFQNKFGHLMLVNFRLSILFTKTKQNNNKKNKISKSAVHNFFFFFFYFGQIIRKVGKLCFTLRQ